MMLRLSFALIALHPFFPTYVVGFSAASCRNNYNDNTNIMRSRRTWRRNHHDVIFQLNVAMAVDQTVVDAVPTATSSRSKKKKKQEIKEKSRSYDFISVEEAENALRRERARYEGERSELQRLVDVQSRQIRELSERGMHTTTTTTTTTTGKDKGISDNDAVVDKDTSVQIIVHDSSVTGVINNGKRIRRNSRSNKGSSSSNNNSNKEENANIMAKMKRMEIEFREVLMDNEELTRNFRDQRHQFLAERDDLEDQIKEEQIRLDCARDELHMERAYFETSRRMLERLLDDEQQKVQELEQELLMLITREQIFSEQKRSLEQQEQKLRQEYAQTQQKEKENDEGEEQQQQQQQRQHEYAQQMQEENVYVYNDSTTDRKESMVGGNPGGFSMLNNNDVHCPLYP